MVVMVWHQEPLIGWQEAQKSSLPLFNPNRKWIGREQRLTALMGGLQIRLGEESGNLGSSGEPWGRTHNSVLLAETIWKSQCCCPPPVNTHEFNQLLFALLLDIQNPWRKQPLAEASSCPEQWLRGGRGERNWTFGEMGHHFCQDKVQCEILRTLYRGWSLVSQKRKTFTTLPPSLVPANLFSQLQVFLLHLG